MEARHFEIQLCAIYTGPAFSILTPKKKKRKKKKNWDYSRQQTEAY